MGAGDELLQHRFPSAWPEVRNAKRVVENRRADRNGHWDPLRYPAHYQTPSLEFHPSSVMALPSRKGALGGGTTGHFSEAAAAGGPRRRRRPHAARTPDGGPRPRRGPVAAWGGGRLRAP